MSSTPTKPPSSTIVRRQTMLMSEECGIGVYAIAHQGRGGRRQAVQCNGQLVPRQRLGIKKNSDTWAAVLLDEVTTVRIIHGLKQALSC